jgi:arabinofuranan 3-O-arabinosyltransferase
VKAGSLQLLTDQFLAGSRPRVVALSFGGAREITRKVDEDGFVRWPARRFSSVTIRFLEWDETTSVDALTGVPTPLPVGVSEVVVPGMPNQLQGADLATGAPCGYGPRLRVGSKRFSTSVQGSVEDVLKGRPLTWQVCGTKGNALDLPAGSVRLTAEASSEFSPLDVKLTRAGGAVAMSSGRATPLAVTGRTATAATVEVPARVTPSLLVLPQNFNAGWTATDERGRELSAVRVNGWQQGWSLPAGEAVTLSASFGPAGAYRVFLVVGALMCLACAVAVTLTRGSSGPVPQVGGLAGRREAGSLGVVALFLVGGVAGVAAAVLGVATGLAARRRRWLVVVPPAAVVVAAGLWVSAIPWPASNRGATSVVVQVLVLAATGVACVAPLVVEPGRRSVRRPRRMRGRSRP